MRKLLAGTVLLCWVLAAGAQQTDSKDLDLTVDPQAVVDLSWDASASTVIGYNAYRSDQDGGPYTRLNATVIPILTYAEDTVERGRTYFYVVTAVRADSVESVNSNQAIAVVPPEPSP